MFNQILNEVYNLDIDPKFLLSFAHKPSSMLLVWWYNLETGEFKSTSKPGINHANDYFEGVVELPDWVRGRAFQYKDRRILMVYQGGKFKPVRNSLIDILDKVLMKVDNIQYVVDQDGHDLSNIFEGITKFKIGKLI